MVSVHVRLDGQLALDRKSEHEKRGLQNHPDVYASKLADQLAKYSVRKDVATGEDVVPRPRQRLFIWLACSGNGVLFWNCKKGKTIVCIFSLMWAMASRLQPENINFRFIQLRAGYQYDPNKSGTFSVVCGEYCGGVNAMVITRCWAEFTLRSK